MTIMSTGDSGLPSRVLADVLAPFRKVDVDKCMKLVETSRGCASDQCELSLGRGDPLSDQPAVGARR